MNDDKRSFSALYIKDFRLLLLAQTASLSGTWMHMAGQGWLVYKLTHSPFYLGLVGASLSLPILIFTLFGGIIADRYPKRDMLVLTQSLSILPPILLGILVDAGVVNVWHTMMIAFVIGTINAFDIPLRQSFLVEVVGKGHLLNAIALNSASFHGARIIGPLIAGFVISEFGIAACFYINGLSFIPVLIALKRMVFKGRGRVGSPRNLFGEMKEGFRFIMDQKNILTIILTIMIFSLFGIPYNQFLPVFAEDIFHVGARGLGFMMGAAGLGAFCAAMLMAYLGDIRDKKRYMSVASIIFPAAIILFSLSSYYRLSLSILLFAGWAAVSFLATANSYIQLNVEDTLRGRVMSVYSLVFLGMSPIGSALIGGIADSIGTTRALTLSGSLCLLAGLIFVRRQYRAARR
jgi:MFS family permease